MRLLVDGNRWRQSFDFVDIRLVHLSQELAGVCRQRLDIPTLALRENRIERQRRLAGAGQAREYDKFVSWDLEIDVFEVVFPCTPNHDFVLHIQKSRPGGLAAH